MFTQEIFMYTHYFTEIYARKLSPFTQVEDREIEKKKVDFQQQSQGPFGAENEVDKAEEAKEK